MSREHADVVGSLLRPSELVAAQSHLTAGALSPREFKEIEDRAVDHAVSIQEEAGLGIVTDGEMRRLSFQSQMTAAVEGFGDHALDAFLWGDWRGDAKVGNLSVARPSNLGVVEKLRRRRHLCAEEFTYLRARTRRTAKITMPSPSLWVNFWSRQFSTHVYPTLESFLADVVDILRDEVAELVRLGATYIQMDAPHYALLIEPTTRAFYEAQAKGLGSLKRWLEFSLELDNAVMSAASPQTIFGFHLCRGNQGSRWLVEGSYEPIGRAVFRQTKARRLLLEYDDARSGSFEPLRHVPEDKMVILGLLTTKQPQLETREELVAQIREASRYVPLERLGLSTQCGFASSIVGNKISVEDEKQKLRLLVEVTRAVWDSR